VALTAGDQHHHHLLLHDVASGSSEPLPSSEPIGFIMDGTTPRRTMGGTTPSTECRTIGIVEGMGLPATAVRRRASPGAGEGILAATETSWAYGRYRRPRRRLAVSLTGVVSTARAPITAAERATADGNIRAVELLRGCWWALTVSRRTP
jgi:hypothetical protein